MDGIIEYFNHYGLDFLSILKVGCILLLGLGFLYLVFRFIFGKGANIHHSISSAIAIIFTFLCIIALKYAGPRFEAFIAPMPFAAILEDQLFLFSFSDAHYTQICAELVSMILLTFFVNIADSFMPKKRNIFYWLFFRILTIVTSLLLHLILCALMQKYLSQGIITYAPVILLCILILLLLTGALKLLVGVALTSVNPLIAGLYTFFFASTAGKMLSRAILTTAILAGFVVLLNHLGLSIISITEPALISYIPFYVTLALLWYGIGEKSSK